MAKLLVQESNGAREFELVDLEVAIGRELDNTLRLSDPSISRHHAVIRQSQGGYEIEDLGSSNGVLLNGNRVPSAPLQDGDRITLGQMQLTFVDPRPAAENNPLGTVRMNPEDMARLRADVADVAAEPAEPPAAAAQEPPAAPAPAKPGPAFLHAYLPAIPDDALPLRSADGAVERGDFQTRLKAALIDGAPMLVITILGMLLTVAIQEGAGFGAVTGLGCLFSFVQLALLVAYLILLPTYWMRCGASPGKKIMQLRVVPEDDPGGRLDISAAVLRLLGYLVNGIISWILMVPVTRLALGIMVTPLLGFHLGSILALWAMTLLVGIAPYLLILGADRRGLEDRFSRSIVIKVDR